MAIARERTGVLVVRVWLEDEDAPQLRARITSTRDVLVPETTEAVLVASEKEIIKTVRAWLRVFTASH